MFNRYPCMRVRAQIAPFLPKPAKTGAHRPAPRIRGPDIGPTRAAAARLRRGGRKGWHSHQAEGVGRQARNPWCHAPSNALATLFRVLNHIGPEKQ